MRNLIKISFMMMVAVFFISCANDETKTTTSDNEQIDLSNLEINLKSLPNFSVLFEWQDETELRDRSEPAFLTLINESLDELDSRNDIDQVITVVGLTDGKAYIDEIHLIDYANDRTVEIYTLDRMTGNYNILQNTQGSISNGEDETGPCPSGYTLLKSCSNSDRDALPACIGGAIRQYLTANLKKAGDCTEVRVKVTLTGTKVCGKTC